MFIYPRWTIDTHAIVAVPLSRVGGHRWRGVGMARPVARAARRALLFFGGSRPALGFFNVYPFRYSFVADHFQYLASLGIITLAAAGIVRLIARRPDHRTTAVRTAVAVVMLPLSVITLRRSAAYVNAETLYRNTMAANPSSWMAHNNLGRLLLTESRGLVADPAAADPSSAIAQRRQQMLAESADEFEAAMRLKPDLPQAHNNLGSVFMDLGRLPDAKTEFDEALQREPNDEELQFNLGLLAERMGRYDEAIEHLHASIRVKPDSAEAYEVLGNTLESAGRNDEAIEAYRSATRLDPSNAEAHHNLGAALGRAGKLPEAVAEFQDTLRLNPQSVNADSSLGLAYMRMGRIDDAIAKFSDAVSLAPASAPAHFSLANALDTAGRHDEAIQEYPAGGSRSAGVRRSLQRHGHRGGGARALSGRGGGVSGSGAPAAGLCRGQGQPRPGAQDDQVTVGEGTPMGSAANP